MAFDVIAGKEVPAALYRHVGEVTDCIEYSARETAEMILACEHWGPWDASFWAAVQHCVRVW